MNSRRYIARCKACGVYTSALASKDEIRAAQLHAAWPLSHPKPQGLYMHRSGTLVLDCRQCGQPKYAQSVRGAYSAKHVCNDRCMSSHGTVCECSCGGKNHGGAFDTRAEGSAP